jgi:hypothetical protein
MSAPQRNTPIIVDERHIGHAVGADKRPVCGEPGPKVRDDMLDLFIAEWHLQSHPQYRMPPATACPVCFPVSECAGLNVVAGRVVCRGCGIDLGEWPDLDAEEVAWNPGGYCAFGCVTEVEEPEPTDDEIADEDLRHQLAEPCPECGAAGACAYDDHGRPLIHAAADAGEQER